MRIGYLTETQEKVLNLFASGLTTPEVAHLLGISESGVKSHTVAIRARALRLTGRDFSNTMGAAFALQLAGVFTHDPSVVEVMQTQRRAAGHDVA